MSYKHSKYVDKIWQTDNIGDNAITTPKIADDTIIPADVDVTKDYPFSGVVGSAGATLYGDGSGITDVGAAAATALTLEVTEENTSAIAKGQAVYVSGATGNKTRVGLASCIDSGKIRVIGLAAEDIDQNGDGFVRTKGVLTDVNDSAATGTDVNPNGETWVAGDLLYLADSTGGMTNVQPTSGRVIRMAYTLKGDGTSDDLLVISHENPVNMTAAAGEDIVIRMGDTDGVNSVVFKDYDNNTIGKASSKGKWLITDAVFSSDVVFESDVLFNGGFKTDSIGERTAEHGVTVDGLSIKDGDLPSVPASVSSEIDTDVGTHSDLTTGTHGVTGTIVGTAKQQTFTAKNTFASDIVFQSDIIWETDPTFETDVSFKSSVVFESDTTFETDIAISAGKTFDGIDVSVHDAAITGVHGISGTIVGTSEEQTLTNKTLTSPIMADVLGAGGFKAVEIVGGADGGNWVALYGSAAGSGCSVYSKGTEANIDLILTGKGTGLVDFNSEGIKNVGAMGGVGNVTFDGTAATITNAEGITISTTGTAKNIMLYPAVPIGSVIIGSATNKVTIGNDGKMTLGGTSYIFMGDANLEVAAFKNCKVTTDARGTPVEGDLKWDGTAHKLQVYSGTAWETVTSVG